MTLAINITITEQDIKHVRQSDDLYKLAYPLYISRICEFLCKSASPGECNADLQRVTQMFKRQFHAQNDRFEQTAITNYFLKCQSNV